MKHSKTSDQSFLLARALPVITSQKSASEFVVPIQLVTSRDRYRCCHIYFSDSLPGELQPAIWFENHFYSLCRTVLEDYEAFKVAMHLTERGRSIVITKIPKGYAIWILEPDAISSTGSLSSGRPVSPISLPCKALMAHDQYQLCQIQLLHRQEPCFAVRVGTFYYELFRSVKTVRQAAKLVKLLLHRNKKSIITKMPQGYGVWHLIDELVINA